MLVNPKIKEELYENAGEIRVQKARLYAKTGRVDITKVNYTNKDNFEITGKVIGQEIYRTNIMIEQGEISDITCECQDYRQRYAACKHIIATIMEFDENQKYENMLLKDKSALDINKRIRANAKYRSFTQIVNELYEEEMHEAEERKVEELSGKIKIEPRLIYDRYYTLLKMDFKIGDKRMYKIKNLVEFFERMQRGEKFKYGNNLEFIHNKEAFAEENQPILDFILRHAETINFVNSNSNSNYRYYGKALDETSISISQTMLDEIFDLFKDKEIDFKSDAGESTIKFIEEDPKLHFLIKKINEDEYKIVLNNNINLARDFSIFEGKNNKYVLLKRTLYKCSKNYEDSVIKLLSIFKENYLTEISFGKEQLPELFSVIIPRLKNNIEYQEIEEQDIEKYKPKKLVVKMFLDFDENNRIIAEIKFCYGEIEFNPLQPKIDSKYPRDMIAENKAVNMLRKTGFMFYEAKGCFILPD